MADPADCDTFRLSLADLVLVHGVGFLASDIISNPETRDPVLITLADVLSAVSVQHRVIDDLARAADLLIATASDARRFGAARSRASAAVAAFHRWRWSLAYDAWRGQQSAGVAA